MNTTEATIPAPAASMPVLPLDAILTIVSDRTRWRVLNELLKGEPLPVSEIGRRLGTPATNISKHCALMQRTGILQRGFGSLYRIPAAFLVPGQRALDLGAVVLRLDRLDAR